MTARWTQGIDFGVNCDDLDRQRFLDALYGGARGTGRWPREPRGWECSRCRRTWSTIVRRCEPCETESRQRLAGAVKTEG